MADDFKYDVFLSHSSKDKAVVRDVAERLRADGLRVWFDEWEVNPGDNIAAKIEEGLEQSRVLVFCMSANAFGSEWAQLEAGTFRFRDPLNKERRFIPLRLDKAQLPGSLAQFLYINWLPDEHDQEYAKLREGCRPPTEPTAAEEEATRYQVAEKVVQLDYQLDYTSSVIILAFAFSPDGKHALSCDVNDHIVRLWDLETGLCLRVLEGHAAVVDSVAWSADGRRALSGSHDTAMRLWDVETGRCLGVLEGHTSAVWSVVWSADQRRALSSGHDQTVRLWDVGTGRCLRVLKGHTDGVSSVVWSADQHRALSGGHDNTLRLWDLGTGRCLRVFEGHTNRVRSVASNTDDRRALSSSSDNTVRLWDLAGRCLRVLEGHADDVTSVA